MKNCLHLLSKGTGRVSSQCSLWVQVSLSKIFCKQHEWREKPIQIKHSHDLLQDQSPCKHQWKRVRNLRWQQIWFSSNFPSLWREIQMYLHIYHICCGLQCTPSTYSSSELAPATPFSTKCPSLHLDATFSQNAICALSQIMRLAQVCNTVNKSSTYDDSLIKVAALGWSSWKRSAFRCLASMAITPPGLSPIFIRVMHHTS